MKFVCTQSDLNTNLSLVSRAVPSRPTHPVLANVLAIADRETQRVHLTAFDLSLGIRTSFSATVEEGGTLTLPAKLFNDIVSRLPDGEIELDDAAGEAIATLTSTSGRYQVRGMGAEEFPDLPTIDEGEVIYLPAEAFLEGLKGTLFATSPDETKQVLTGVHLKVQQDCLEFAATDGHRLAVVQTPLHAPEGEEEVRKIEEFEITIPARALRELERMLGMRHSTQPVELRFDEGQISFQLENQCLNSRKLEGAYPAYGQLIPRQFLNQVTVERRSFLAAVERIAVLADQKNNILKCSMDTVNQEISLSVDAKDVGNGRESMPAQIASDDPKEVAFNIKYLVDGLKVINSTDLQIQLNAATSPVILTPVGGVKMTYLVMPVQIRN